MKKIFMTILLFASFVGASDLDIKKNVQFITEARMQSSERYEDVCITYSYYDMAHSYRYEWDKHRDSYSWCVIEAFEFNRNQNNEELYDFDRKSFESKKKQAELFLHRPQQLE